MSAISRVLVANRGEIAVRIIRACRALGLETVLAASAADRDALPASLAHRVVCIGPPRPRDSYLRVDTLLTACRGTGADAIHPGYGFLAEAPLLAEACALTGIRFVGPAADSIARMGNKLAARALAERLGIPTLQGSPAVTGPDEALRLAGTIGYPLLLKAAAGGGGRGMRIVHGPEELRSALPAVSAEVRSAFGDPTVYLESWIPNARHVEVQVLGDTAGSVIHLGERDCTVQRRFQKVIEEAPSPAVSGELRRDLCAAAVRLARAIGYHSAGTVEFLVDQDAGTFHFLEMNTRIQVEHPVTEQITGLDLVAGQLRIAGGEPLGVTQEQVRFSGHAIECRINAESVENGFRPSPGRIAAWRPPVMEGIRLETQIEPGALVSPHYDSLIAKVIATGAHREDALARMAAALRAFHIGGVETNLTLHLRVLEHPDFRRGRINTRWLEEQILNPQERTA